MGHFLDDAVWIARLDQARPQGHAGRRVAAHGLDDHVRGRNVGHLAAHGLGEVADGHQQDPLDVPAQRHGAVHGPAQQARLPAHGQQHLGPRAAGKRPQPRAGAADHDHSRDGL